MIEFINNLITMLLKQYCGRSQKSHSFINNSLVYLLSLLTFSTLIIQTFFSYTPLLGLVYTQLKTGEKDIVFNPLQNNRLNSTRFAQGLDMDIVPRISEQFVINNKTIISGQFINLTKYSELDRYPLSDMARHRIFVSSLGQFQIQKEGTLTLAISSYFSLIKRVIDRYQLSKEEKTVLLRDLSLLAAHNVSISGEVEFVKIGPQIIKKLKVQYGGDYYLFMDMGTTFQYLFKSSWKNIVQRYNTSLSLLSFIQNPNFSMYHFTKQIIANFHNRFETYRLLNEQQIRVKINEYLNKAANIFDLSSFDSHSPVLQNAYAFSQVNIVIYLLFSFIIFLFLVLCYTAINSTMFIKMELEKKDIIIMKLLGANSLQLCIRIMKSIFTYILLSNIIGISASILVLHGLSYEVSDILDRDFSFAFDHSTIFSVVFVGFILPVSVASLYAYRGLKNVKVSNLGEGQEQIKEVKTQVYVEDQRFSLQTFILATVVTVYGYLIYFMLPSVFNSRNTQIISNAFVMFLYGIVIGAIKLLDSLQYIFQKTIAKLALFRLDKFLYNLILKNLSINRIQNRKISLVYMMSTISLIALSLNVQFQINASMTQFFNFRGGHIVIYMDFKPQFYNNLLSKLPQVKAYSFITKSYQQYFKDDRKNVLMSDMTRTYYQQSQIYGVAGPFFPNEQKWRLSASYTEVQEPYGFLGWLNTENGQNTAIVGQNMVRKLDLKSSIDKRFLINIVRNNTILRFPLKISTVNTKHLTLYFTYKNDASSQVGVNIDVFKSLTGIPDDQFQFGRVVIQLEDLKYTQTVVNQIKKAINLNKLQFNQIWTLQSQQNSLRSILKILLLSLRIVLVLFSIICFSSLSSTNYITVHNQARSIGILLSLGLQENKIRKIYKYETFILLLCTTLKSIIISHLISSIIVYQRDLFSNANPENTFQINTYLLVILLAAISSYFSSKNALDQIFTKSISHMIKRKD